MNMFNLIVTLLIWSLTTISLAQAEDWVSPIEERYGAQSPVLYEKLKKAHSLLNTFNGVPDRLASAKTLLDEILNEDLNFAPAFREYARLYIVSGPNNHKDTTGNYLTSAEAAIFESLRLEPDYADAYVLLGHVYTLMKKYSKAEKVLKLAIAKGSKNPWLPLNYAKLLEKTNRAKETLPYYMAVVNSNTANPKAMSAALNSVAKYYRDSHQYEEADHWYNILIEYKPSAWNLTDYAEFVLFHKGDPDKSIELGEKALQKLNYKYGHYILACAYFTKGFQILAIHGQEEANHYFYRAQKLYRNTQEIFNRLLKYPATRKIASNKPPHDKKS